MLTVVVQTFDDMRTFARFGLLLAVLLTVSFGSLLLRSWRSKSKATTCLTVSEPIFALQTNVQGIHPIIRISVSNAGPVNLGFDLAWLECRNRSDNRLLTVNPLPPGRSKKSTVLLPASATNVVMEVLTDAPPDEALLFCCEFTWIEKESRLFHFATQVDRPMYWLASLVGSDWHPPWRFKRFAGGELFTSNIGVGEYFSRAYGFTSGQWFAEQRSEQQMVDDLRRSQPTARFMIRRGEPFAAEEQQAKDAFAVFCRTSSALASNGELDAAPNGRPGAPSADSRVQRGHHW
jgi:hypothetical protein